MHQEVEAQLQPLTQHSNLFERNNSRFFIANTLTFLIQITSH